MPKTLAKKPWAILVYIAGDNNLSSSGLEDVEEMCIEGASPRVHVAVEIDVAGEFDGSIRYEITEKLDNDETAFRTVIERLDEQDSGAPKALREFLGWGMKRYPATNRVLVVWGHGAGFRATRRDVAPDDFGNSLDMNEIESVLKRSGIGPKKKLAIIGFDACLMNMIEVAHHLSHYAHILVGSQQTEPSKGWPYDQVIAATKRKNATRQKVAKRIVDAYLEYYREAEESGVTQSAIDLSKTQSAVNDLHDLGALLKTALDYDRTRTDQPAEKSRDKIRRLRVRMQTFEFGDYVDLVHMAEVLPEFTTNLAIIAAANRLARSAGKCVIHQDHEGPELHEARGISVWFPAERRLYYQYRGKYLALNCNKQRRDWVNFLDAFHD